VLGAPFVIYLMEELPYFCANYFYESFDRKSRDWVQTITRCVEVASRANIPDDFP